MTTFNLSRKQSALVSMALLFICAGQTHAATGPLKGDLHVFAVGVDNPVYMTADHHLRSAHKDALAQVKFWQTQQRLFNNLDVQPALINDQATCEAILRNLDQMIERCRPGDTAVIAPTGHGGCGSSSEWGYCAFDRTLRRSEIAERIERLAKKGVLVILMVDTCESGAINIQGDNIIVLTACTAKQNAYENADNGFFTKAILEGFAGAADLNKDGIVTLSELDSYVSLRMEKLNSKQSTTCGKPVNIPSNLPLAQVASGDQPTAVVPSFHGTGPIRIRK